ncbi:MAG TPA: glycosyltransferase [Thermoleophilaceae bacterium]
MARILAYTSPARGHLFPLTAILDELRGRGHEIALRTLAAEVEPSRARGFHAAPIEPRIEALEHDDWRARTPTGALKRAMRVFAQRAELDAPDLRSAIAEERPDAAIVDVNCWGAIAAAEAWGGPWATFCPYPLPISSPDAPPYGPGLAPARGPLGRARDRALRPLLDRSFARAMLPPVNAVRATLGLDPLAGTDDLFARPPLVLYMTAEPFEYAREWPEGVVLVGPCEWDPPAEPPDWLAAIERPIVLVTSSSELQDDARLVQAALDGLTEEDVQVVATLPSQDPGAFRAPPNARLERFVPHGPILERAACAVTHGGMGATQKALARGVPVCAVPFGRDQLEVARRVEVAGAGTRLAARRLGPDRLRAKVREAIGCAEGARRVAAGFAAAGGPAAAADAVERRLLAPS